MKRVFALVLALLAVAPAQAEQTVHDVLSVEKHNMIRLPSDRIDALMKRPNGEAWPPIPGRGWQTYRRCNRGASNGNAWPRRCISRRAAKA